MRSVYNTFFSLVIVMGTACQSRQVERTPNSISNQNLISGELFVLAQNLLDAFAQGSEPRRMLFQHFFEATQVSNFAQSKDWTFLQRQFVFLQLLNRQLDADPLVRPTSYEAQDYILKIEKILSTQIDLAVTEKELEKTDQAVILNFLADHVNQVNHLVSRAEVHLTRSDKNFIQNYLVRVIQFVKSQQEYSPMMSRTLASEGNVDLLTQKDWMRFQKIGFTSITVVDQGDIFGGADAIEKALSIQYGLQFISLVLNPRNQFIGKPALNL
jgi:hypothetical protein